MRVIFKFLWFGPGGRRFKPKRPHYIPDELRDQLPSTAEIISDEDAAKKQREIDRVPTLEEQYAATGASRVPKNFIEAMQVHSSPKDMPSYEQPPAETVVLEPHPLQDMPDHATDKLIADAKEKADAEENELVEEISEEDKKPGKADEKPEAFTITENDIGKIDSEEDLKDFFGGSGKE